MGNTDSDRDVRNLFGAYIRQSPRTAGAVAFGVSVLVVQHFAWRPGARMSGLAPALTLTVALCHAIAGAMTGPRLADGMRTSTASRAALVGAVTSLLAIVLFGFLFTGYLFATGVRPAGGISYVIFPFLTALFAFAGDGWALVLVSIGVGWALHRAATRR